MALKVRKNISDIVWSDIASDFNLDAQGNIKIVDNVDSVITSMTNIINTFSGERPMLLSFGNELKNLMFENISSDLLDNIAIKIREMIETWDDRVRIVEINTSADVDKGIIYLNVSFQIKSFQGTFNFDTQLQ